MDKLLLSHCLLLCFLTCIIEAQIVNITTGSIQGKIYSSRSGRPFSAFMGVPYAKSPLGNLRFKSPEPAVPWTGVKDATSYGPMCSQIEFILPLTAADYNATGSEDCLTINVFSPKNFDDDSDGESLPVVVYFHGGYFMALSGSTYGPLYFMDHDVILVTFNFRLGAFGFLSTEDFNSPGNVGIKDQRLALKWISENIKSFGGDPGRVTLYGESAGAASVHYHMLSPESRGLFSAGISGSGIAYKVLSYQVDPVASAHQLAEEVGCEDLIGDNAELISCLRAVNGSTIAALSDEFLEVVKSPFRIFCPSTEVNGTSTDPFLTQHPYEIFIKEGQSTVPWLVGVNSAEGLITVQNALSQRDEWVPKINSQWSELAPEFLVYSKINKDLTEDISNYYLSLYKANGTIDFEQDLIGFTNLFTDRLYIQAAIHAAKIQARRSPVFFYYNDYITNRSRVPIGTNHGEESALLFSPSNLTDFTNFIGEGHIDYEQSRLMVDLFVQFATDPHNVRFEGNVLPPIDPDHDDINLNSFIFTNPHRGQQGISTVPQPVIERIKFWEDKNVPPYEEYQLQTCSVA